MHQHDLKISLFTVASSISCILRHRSWVDDLRVFTGDLQRTPRISSPVAQSFCTVLEVTVHPEQTILSLDLFFTSCQPVARPLITILPREETGGRLRVHYSKWTLWVFFTAGSIKVIVCACMCVCMCECAHMCVFSKEKCVMEMRDLLVHKRYSTLWLYLCTITFHM